MDTRASLDRWWTTLGPAARRRLIAHPEESVPSDRLYELSHSGERAAGTYLSSGQGGSDGFDLRSTVVDFINSRAIELAAARALLARTRPRPIAHGTEYPLSPEEAAAWRVVAMYDD
jgi:hypothetical protein